VPNATKPCTPAGTEAAVRAVDAVAAVAMQLVFIGLQTHVVSSVHAVSVVIAAQAAPAVEAATASRPPTRSSTKTV
jgi:hypothetical protein